MDDSRSSAANRYSLSAQVRDAIEGKIATGELAPGDRIVEARIATELHVSSIPVREAIRELVAKRVLEYVVHKGARVREVSMAETIDALEVKAVLEALAARLAGKRIVQTAAVLKACIGPLGESLRERDYVRFQTLNQDFHRTIVEASGNPILLSLWDTLAFEVRTRFIMDGLQTVDPEEMVREHADLCSAVEAGDTEGVASLSISHSSHLVTRLKNVASLEGHRMAKDGMSAGVPEETRPAEGTRSTS
jgi:DNA-binding GntR family transcriptional regulator